MQATQLSDIAAAEEYTSCLLCHTVPCSRACPHGIDPAGAIRSLRFKNVWGAHRKAASGFCSTCESQACMDACVKGRMSRPVAIDALMDHSTRLQVHSAPVDLRTDFFGFTCENPFLLSSSVVGSNYEMVAKAFAMGWAGVAFKTVGIFVPEEVSPRFATDGTCGKAFNGFKNIEQISDHSLEENAAFLRRLKEDFPSKLIIASIMGTTDEEWTSLARIMTNAGADCIELNFSCPNMVGDGLGSDAGQDPELVAQYTRAARKGTHLPLLAKMTPNLGNMEIPAIAAMEHGADGIAAINTIKSIMNVRLDSFASEPCVDGKSAVGGYSGNAVKPIALRFIHDMKKHRKLKDVPISGMGGIETWKDAAEFIAMGCGTVQVTTSVMQYGYRIIDDMIEGLSGALGDMGYTRVDQLMGRALEHVLPPAELNRESIVYPKFDGTRCVGCGRCYIACYDGGHQAITLNDEGKPKLIPKKCVGCHLCRMVCPAEAIGQSRRRDK